MSKTIGPREQALRAMRESNYDRGHSGPVDKSPARLRALQESVTMSKAKTAPKRAGKPMKKKAKAARRAKTKPAKSAPAGDGDGPRADSKTATVAAMLTRPGGCTSKDILDATGWPTVSVPQMAKAAGLKLSKTKEGRAFRYHGTQAAAAA